MNEYMLWAWARFSFTSTGIFLPINFLDNEEAGEETGELMAFGYLCEDGAAAIVCRNGSSVRRLVLTFPFDKAEIIWN